MSLLNFEEKEAFFDRGFFVRRKVFGPTVVSRLLRSFDQLQQEAAAFRETTLFKGAQFVVSGPRIDRIVWAGGRAPELLEVSHSAEVLVPVSQLLGSLTLCQIICQAHFKLPGDKLEFPWHQDSQFRGYGTKNWVDVNQNGSFVQTLIALDPTPEESGPLKFMPYTVKRGHLGLDQKANIKKFLQFSEVESVLLEPGDIVFFHPFAVHGSTANRSNRPRRVFINGFAYPQANHYVYPGCGLGLSLDVSQSLITGASLKVREAS